MENKHINILMLGRAGSGKGTQVKLLEKFLSKKQGVDIVDGGHLLRNLISENKSITTIKVQKTMELGELVPTWLSTTMYINKILSCIHVNKSLIFDGVRRIKQVKLLTEVLNWHERNSLIGIHIHIAEEEVYKRLKSRNRHDDNDEAIKRRMVVFKKEVLPTLKYFEKENRLITINGHNKPEIIFENIKAELKIRKLI